MSSNEDSPSYQRRQALREADASNTIRVLDSYPLPKYFDLSQRLLDAFQKAVDQRQMDEAYVYGMRFATFGVESLPKHKDWRTTGIYNKQKRRNAQQVDKVLAIMEIIKQRMDAEELVRQERTRAEEEERQKLIKEKELQLRREEKKKQEQQRKEFAEKNKSIEQSAMTKLMAMQQSISSSKVQVHDASTQQNTETHVDHAEQPIPSKEDIKTAKTKSHNQVLAQDKEIPSPTSPVWEVAPVPANTPSKESSSITRKMTPRASKEQRTIDLLQEAIRAQEKRLDEIENTQIPALVRLAKQYLQEQEVNRQSALKCVAHKRSLERQVDVIKAAIFNMETQMFMLENAMEDRQVQKALTEAAQAMKGLQQSVGIDETSTTDLADLTAALPVMTFDHQDNDDELLEELQEWIAPSEKETGRTAKEEDMSLITMPAVPNTSIEANNEASSTSSIDKLLKAILG